MCFWSMHPGFAVHVGNHGRAVREMGLFAHVRDTLNFTIIPHVHPWCRNAMSMRSRTRKGRETFPGNWVQKKCATPE